MSWLPLIAIVVVALALSTTAIGDTSSESETDMHDDYGPAVRAIAEAIARAEGFYASGSLPQRAHNPGDLKLGDRGNGTINGKTVFASDDAGWLALYAQVDRMLAGRSAYYSADDSIASIAATWTGNDAPDAWADIVVARLRTQGYNVTTASSLSEVA